MNTKLLSIFLILCSSCLVRAQAPDWQWVKDAYSSGNEVAYDVAYDFNSNNVYTGGYFDSNLGAFYGPLLANTFGGRDGLVAKYSCAGALQWAIKIGGTGDDEVNSIAVDGNGDVYVSGIFRGTADFDPSPLVYNLIASGLSGQPDGFLAKYTSAGTLVWAVKFGGNSSEDVNRMFCDANGIYLTGSYYSNATFYSTSNTTKATAATQGDLNFFGVKYNSNGVVQWVVSAGSGNRDEGLDVVADNGKVYFIGSYENSLTIYNASGNTNGTLPVMNSGNSDVFILAYNQSGALIWSNNVCSSGDDSGNGLTQDANNIYITGSIRNIASFKYPAPTFTKSCAGGMDFYVSSLSKNDGSFQWVSNQTGSGNSDEIAYEIVMESNGSLVTAGYFTGSLNHAPYGGGNLQSSGNEDVFICAFSTSGNYQWSKRAGANNKDVPYGLTPSNDGVYISGEYSDAAAFGPFSLYDAAGRNLFLAKIGCPVISNNFITPNSQTLCAGTVPQPLTGSTPVGGLGAYSFLWQESTDSLNWASASGVNNTQHYSPPALNVTTHYRRVTTAAITCTPSVSDPVTMRIGNLPSAANAGPDQSLCSDKSNLSAVAPVNGSGLWTVLSGGALVTAPTNPTSPVTGLSAGENKFVWTVVSAGNCPSSSDTMWIMRDAFPSPAFAGNNQVICGSAATLSAAPPQTGSGQWTVLSGNGSVQYPFSPSTEFSMTQGEHLLVWAVSNGNCPSSKDTLKITSYDKPLPAFAGDDLNVCGETAVLAAQPASAGTGSWSLVSGSALIGNPSLSNSILSKVQIGDHIFRWTVQNGICPMTYDEVKVHRDISPDSAVAGNDIESEIPEALLSAREPTLGAGRWMLISGEGEIDDSGKPVTSVRALGTGNNVFRWSVSNGACPENFDDVIIYVKPLQIPNAFSPNGDGFNDNFVIPSIDYYPNVKFFVYNRWGSLVYSSENYRNTWSGRNQQNEMLADDTYYFTLEIPKKQNVNGFIILKQNK